MDLMEYQAKELFAKHGVPVTVRDTRGREIDGACGQLAASASAPTPSPALTSTPSPAGR